MREERGTLAGDQLITEDVEIMGSIGGNLTVGEGGKVYLRGAVYGDILVDYGGRLHIFGRATRTLTVNRGGKAIHSGVLGGDVVNMGGRIFIEDTATITGKIKTKKGETKVAPLYQGKNAPVDPPTRRGRGEEEERKRYDL